MPLQIYSGDEAKRRNQRSAELCHHLRGQSYDRTRFAASVVFWCAVGMVGLAMLAYVFGVGK